MANYKKLSNELSNIIEKERKENTFKRVAFDESGAIRRLTNPHDEQTVWRTAFIRDVDKILNCPFYNRYADKTQVFSFYKNDDLTHRSLHVQLVSRIARTIGKALNLNLDLIEAIALGHDIGHTPFGHAGESILDKLYHEQTGRHFAHNIHSVRVLQEVFPLNITLQTLDGIASHNGELEMEEYHPTPYKDFKIFDEEIESCYIDANYIKKLTPSTLEGCVVRISDIIAYLGKDRHDAEKSDLISSQDFSDFGLGKINAEIVNNLMVNIIENSYGKGYIKMDKDCFEALQKCKAENNQNIYKSEKVKQKYETVEKMARLLYERLLEDLQSENKTSPIFTHHIAYIEKPFYKRIKPYILTEPNQIVVDYIASMTDDYFIDLFHHLFPKSTLKIEYTGYFD